MLDVNVNGTFLFARAAGKHMIDQKIKGSIIMVSSMSGSIVNKPQKQSAYNVVCIYLKRSLRIIPLRSFIPSGAPQLTYHSLPSSPKPPSATSCAPSRQNGASTGSE